MHLGHRAPQSQRAKVGVAENEELFWELLLLNRVHQRCSWSSVRLAFQGHNEDIQLLDPEMFDGWTQKLTDTHFLTAIDRKILTFFCFSFKFNLEFCFYPNSVNVMFCSSLEIFAILLSSCK